MCVCVCVCVYIYIYIYAHIYLHQLRQFYSMPNCKHVSVYLAITDIYVIFFDIFIKHDYLMMAVLVGTCSTI